MNCFESFKSNTVSYFANAEKRFFDSARTAGIYEGKLEEAVKRYKYAGRTFLYKPLSDFALLRLEKFITSLGIDVVVPVPLNAKRLRKRGFHHSFLIAREISKSLGCKVDHSNLIKHRDSTPQVELMLKERRDNIKGTFSIRGDHTFKDEVVLLVDDVITSASTLNECAKVLKNRGSAKCVHCLAVAGTI